MKQYLENLKYIIENGSDQPSRPGITARATFGMVIRHDMRDGFPLLTTKKVNLKTVLAEMFGFFRGATNIKEFKELDCNLWDAWALEHEHYSIEVKTNQEIANELGVDVETILMVGKTHAAWTEKLTNTLIDNTMTQEEFYQQNPEPLTLVKYLEEKGVDSHKRVVLTEAGALGPIYGKQWTEWIGRNGEVINQVKNLIDMLRTNPADRRMVVTGWNPSDIAQKASYLDPRGNPISSSKQAVEANVMNGKMALPPCHLMNMFMVENGATPKEPKVLNMSLIMRSSDYAVGLPFNLAGYAATLAIIAKQVNMVAGEILIFSNNAHLYSDQIELAKEQITRTPTKLPTLTIPDGIDITDPSTLTLENIHRICDNLEGYEPQAFIKYPVAV